ncbi:MAG: ParB/RepB/Spo0J family partition protein [Bacilli bacterium]|nr:ParB/RepB/Spo0J family partition protein [Bacilli bacterium]
MVKLNTSLIIPNKYQPRKVFDEQSLKSLADSIKKYGIINPILVRIKDDKYEIIAGERRFRAATQIGLTEVPVIIKTADEQQMAELALIENLERQGLSPIEEAKSYEEIMRIGNQTQASLAEKLGKSQSSIANKIRLLSLPEEVQDALAHKKISERHARSLINIEDKDKQLELLNRIITEKLTVKETDQIINKKETQEEEIKQAISDIMKSLNIKEEEKDDENMNNGNFFPNYDNNNAANNNTSLNMMNMQSMNQAPIVPEPEVVMPSIPTAPVAEPQLVAPQAPVFGPQPLPSVSEVPVMAPTMDATPIVPEMPAPIINDAPVFGPELVVPQAPVEPQMPTPSLDAPLFNPNVTMPNPVDLMAQEPEVVMPLVEPTLEVPQPSAVPSFEIPVTEPVLPTPIVEDKLTKLQDLLNVNGYNYKVYSSETDNCVIIEFPKN